MNYKKIIIFNLFFLTLKIVAMQSELLTPLVKKTETNQGEKDELLQAREVRAFDCKWSFGWHNTISTTHTRLCRALWLCDVQEVRKELVRDQFNPNFSVSADATVLHMHETMSTPLIKAIDYLHHIDDFNDNSRLPLAREVCSARLQEIIRLLLIYHADPNSFDSTGQTALHRAAQYGDIDLIKLLILRNANPFLKTKATRKRVTAHILALDAEHAEAADYLTEIMKRKNCCLNS